MPLEVRGHYVAQRRDWTEQGLQEPNAFLAGGAPVVVVAARVLMADVGVGDDEPQVRRDRNGARLERAAVDQKRVPGHAAGGDVLVHDAAAHADEIVLGPLAHLGGRHRLEGQARGGEESVRDADLERGRRAQSGSERNVAPHDEVGADKAATALLQHRRDAEHVVRPVVTTARRGGRVEVELARGVHEHGVDADPAVVTRRAGDERRKIQRRRHDEAVVVVGVLADQVDSSRRAADRRLAAEAQPEFLSHVTRLARETGHAARPNPSAFPLLVDVDEHGGEQHEALDHLLPEDAEADQRHAVVHDAHERARR